MDLKLSWILIVHHKDVVSCIEKLSPNSLKGGCVIVYDVIMSNLSGRPKAKFKISASCKKLFGFGRCCGKIKCRSVRLRKTKQVMSLVIMTSHCLIQTNILRLWDHSEKVLTKNSDDVITLMKRYDVIGTFNLRHSKMTSQNY